MYHFQMSLFANPGLSDDEEEEEEEDEDADQRDKDPDWRLTPFVKELYAVSSSLVTLGIYFHIN
jgi:hypothetical protein